MNGWKDKGVKGGERGRKRSRREKHGRVTGEGVSEGGSEGKWEMVKLNKVGVVLYCVIENWTKYRKGAIKKHVIIIYVSWVWNVT